MSLKPQKQYSLLEVILTWQHVMKDTWPVFRGGSCPIHCWVRCRAEAPCEYPTQGEIPVNRSGVPLISEGWVPHDVILSAGGLVEELNVWSFFLLQDNRTGFVRNCIPAGNACPWLYSGVSWPLRSVMSLHISLLSFYPIFWHKNDWQICFWQVRMAA